MHTEPDANVLKRSALDLLASGNSVDSVAHVLGVSIAMVEGWAREAPATRPMADEAVAPPTTTTSEHAGPRRTHVEPTDFFAQPTATKVVLIAVPVALVALVLSSHLDATFKDANLSGIYHPMMAAGLLIAAYFIVYALRTGFELTGQAVIFREVFGSRELAYVDIDRCQVTRNTHLDVYTLNLYPRCGAGRVTIWFTPEQVRDANIANWIASMRGASDGPIAVPPPTSSPETSASDSDGLGFFWSAYVVLLCVAAAAAFLMEAGPFIDATRLIVQGPPAMTSLDTTEGILLDRGTCQRSRWRSSQSLQIDTGAVIVQRSIPCLIEAADLPAATKHHLAIRTDNRQFAVGEIYEIDLDGRPLLSYSQHVVDKRAGANSHAVVAFIEMLLAGSAFVLFLGVLLRKRR